MRKLISVICAFLCLAAFIPRAAAGEGGDYHTADGYGYTLLDDGTALVTMYPVVSRTVTIPDVLDGIPVTAVGPAAFDNDQEKETIRHIVIADGVLRIGRNAFDGFSKLTYVTLPDSVTEIGEGAFRSCRGLKSVRLPAGLKAIGAEAFDACGLTSVVFPDGLETIG
ncbi:MAG: leucine-rich repeat domain-containing protein, partial [Clostridia bacterium]|nr:leucine-rich repeat domain-containing protein [Clostridia bacterium]